MKDLGPPTLRLRLGLGLNTEPDASLVPRFGDRRAPALTDMALQSGTRVRAVKGVLQKDKGSAAYGIPVVAGSGCAGLGIYPDPVSPELLVAVGGRVYADTDGDGSAWTEIEDDFSSSHFSCAGRHGMSYLVDGLAVPRRYSGEAAAAEITDFPSFDEAGFAAKITPSDILIDAFENTLGILTVASAPTAAGTGYTVGDVLTVTTGGTGGTVTVLTITGGGATGPVGTLEFTTAGQGYTTGTGKATSGGTGADCTISITAVRWAPTGTVTPTDDAVNVRWGAESMKLVFAGGDNGERVDLDLGVAGTLDLSDDDFLGFWMYPSVGGEYFVIKISEDGTNWQHLYVKIEAGEVNTWKQVVWDLSGIDQTNKDAIRYIRFGIPAIQACTIYLDHLTRSGALYGDYQYAFTFLDSDTGDESPLTGYHQFSTAESNAAGGVMPRRCAYIRIPVAELPSGTDVIRVYRTMGGGFHFYKITDLTPSGHAASYTDNTPDSGLTEGLALSSWPGQLPRARWLIPRGDRLWYVGGLFVGARRDIKAYSVDPLNRTTPVIVRNAFPEALIWGFEFRVGDAGGSGRFEWDLERATRGGSSWTVIGECHFLTGTWVANTVYRYHFTAVAGYDLFFSDRYDYRIKCVYRATATMELSSSTSNGTLGLWYRLLVRADNALFMTNLNSWDRTPPIGQPNMPVDDTTGGFFTVASADGQALKGWCKHGSDVLFFKDTLTYVAAGDSTDDFGYALALPSLGLLEEKTAVDCDGAAVWMGQDRQIWLWLADGSAPVCLSEPIREFFQGLTAYGGANAIYWDHCYILFLPQAPAGSRCRLYDFRRRAWDPSYDGQVWAALPHSAAQSALTPYAAVQNGNDIALVTLFGVETDQAGAIAWAGRSGEIDVRQVHGAGARGMRLRAYRLLVDGPAGESLTVSVFRNRATTATQSYSETIPAGTGLREIERYPHSTLEGKTFSLQVSGSHSAAMKVHEIQLWFPRTR